eukprot:2691494-Pleurochrysis_carterae.AAC.1
MAAAATAAAATAAAATAAAATAARRCAPTPRAVAGANGAVLRAPRSRMKAAAASTGTSQAVPSHLAASSRRGRAHRTAMRASDLAQPRASARPVGHAVGPYAYRPAPPPPLRVGIANPPATLSCRVARLLMRGQLLRGPGTVLVTVGYGSARRFHRSSPASTGDLYRRARWTCSLSLRPPGRARCSDVVPDLPSFRANGSRSALDSPRNIL